MDGIWECAMSHRAWSGCLRTSRRKGRGTVGRSSWELERASSAPACGGWEAGPPITGFGKWRAVERQSEGVVVAVDGAGQHNPAGAKGPCFIGARARGKESGQCPEPG